MSDFNQAIVLGNLTKEPEVRTTANGQTVASFSIATNRRWTDKAGEKQEAVEFHNVVVWGKLADIAGQILYKGRKALIVGRLQTRSWEGQDGVKRSTTEIVGQELSALGPSKSGVGGSSEPTGHQATAEPIASGAEGEENQDAAPAPKPATKREKADSADEINLDDIPF